jgi:hypothetical protein
MMADTMIENWTQSRSTSKRASKFLRARTRCEGGSMTIKLPTAADLAPTIPTPPHPDRKSPRGDVSAPRKHDSEPAETSCATPTRTVFSRCPWCGGLFNPRRSGGKPQRFCCPEHRRAFEAAARQYVGRLIAAGELSVAALRTPPATRAFAPWEVSGNAATTVAGTTPSRCIPPIRVFWAGADVAMDPRDADSPRPVPESRCPTNYDDICASGPRRALVP